MSMLFCCEYKKRPPKLGGLRVFTQYQSLYMTLSHNHIHHQFVI